MSAVLKVLLLGFLLHNAHCDEFGISLPKQMVALRGSCLTIPCSFTVQDYYRGYLGTGCRSSWSGSVNDQTVQFTRPTSGDLAHKNCTTTVHGLSDSHSRDFYFRLQCNDPYKWIFRNYPLEWTFRDNRVNIVVKDAPPTPTLTPPTVSEGQLVSIKCSAPVPCPSLPPTLTWRPDLGHVEETLHEQQDKTYVKESTLRFTATHHHHQINITCSAVYRKEDGSLSHASEQTMPFVTYKPKNTRVTVNPSGPVTERSNVTLTCSSDANPAVEDYHWYKADGENLTLIGNFTVLHMNASRETIAFFCEAQNELGTENSTVTELDVQFPPQILNSSKCTGDSLQIFCVCETEGNPFPLIEWSFSGVFPNISISSEPLSYKALESVITFIEPQWSDSGLLVCHSSNPLGSDTKEFEHAYEAKEFQESGIWDGVTLPLLITLIVILLCLIAVLLVVVRAQHVRRSADLDLNQLLPPNEVVSCRSYLD